jgi:hypothetical protein
MLAVRTPGAPQVARYVAACDFCLPLYGIESATPTTIDFGAIFPFTDVPAYNLPLSTLRNGRHRSSRKTWYAAAS